MRPQHFYGGIPVKCFKFECRSGIVARRPAAASFLRMMPSNRCRKSYCQHNKDLIMLQYLTMGMFILGCGISGITMAEHPADTSPVAQNRLPKHSLPHPDLTVTNR